MLNQLVIMGRLTQSPEIFTSENGNVVRFTIANNGYKEETYFIPCVAFGKNADTVQNHLDKGDQIVVVGKLTQRTYQAKDGTKRTAFEVIVNEINFVDVKQKGEPKAEVSDLPIPEIEQDDFLPF
ncbi:MAG: single-stranded DNA-binding protein [Candidatus Moranbacteria bacterium]|nr:single-stranded DNA-binding protein [Candidatus Moranbacteria bacterium]